MGISKRTAKNSVPGRPFVAGQSGNPKGRPKKPVTLTKVLEVARDSAPAAMNAIVAISQIPTTKTDKDGDTVVLVDGATLNAVLKAATTVVDRANTRMVTDGAPIATVEDLIRHGLQGLSQQMQHISGPAEFASLIRAARDLLAEDRRLNEEVRGMTDEEINKQLGAAK